MFIPLKGRKEMEPHLGEDLRNKWNLRLGFGFPGSSAAFGAFETPKFQMLLYISTPNSVHPDPILFPPSPCAALQSFSWDLLTLEGTLPFSCFFQGILTSSGCKVLRQAGAEGTNMLQTKAAIFIYKLLQCWEIFSQKRLSNDICIAGRVGNL